MFACYLNGVHLQIMYCTVYEIEKKYNKIYSKSDRAQYLHVRTPCDKISFNKKLKQASTRKPIWSNREFTRHRI